MKPVDSLRTLYSHPYNRLHPALALCRFGHWHARKRVGRPWIAPIWGARRAIFWPDSHQSMWLAYNHVMDWSEFLLMKRFLRPTDVVVDVGANVGVYTLWASTFVGPGGRIIAFEPDRQAYSRLRQQLALNGLDWVETDQIALAASAGAGWLSSDRDVENYLAVALGSEAAKFVPVSTTDLDTCLSKRGVRHVAYLKIDVEGAEQQIFEGGRRTLSSKAVSLIQFEANDQALKYGGRPADVIEYLRDYGFRTLRYCVDSNRFEDVQPATIAEHSHQNLFATADLPFVLDRLRASAATART